MAARFIHLLKRIPYTRITDGAEDRHLPSWLSPEFHAGKPHKILILRTNLFSPCGVIPHTTPIYM